MINFTKGKKALLSIILMLLGASLITAGVFILINPEQTVDFEKVKAANIKMCETGARAELFQTSSNDKKDLPEITLFTRGLEDWKAKLYSASYVIASPCENFNLIEFCMGELCIDNETKREINGVYMVLKHKKQIAK